MKKKVRDRAYWDDCFRAFFIKKGYGTYEEGYEAFIAAYPQYREFEDDFAHGRAKAEIIKRLDSGFRQNDANQHEDPQPTPPHLRQQFLPLHIDVPPLSPSISAFDGQGRLAAEAASPKQHRQHHRIWKRYHQKGVNYREHAEQGWTELIETIKNRLPNVEHLENLPLREVVIRLQEAQKNAAADDHDAAAEATSAL